MKCLEEANSETKHRIEVIWSWGREGMGGCGCYCLMGTEFMFGMMKKF